MSLGVFYCKMYSIVKYSQAPDKIEEGSAVFFPPNFSLFLSFSINTPYHRTLEELAKFVLIGREKLTAVRAEIRAIQKVGLSF